MRLKIFIFLPLLILSVCVSSVYAEDAPPTPTADKASTPTAESQVHYKKGRELVLENKLDEAIKEFKQAIALSPDYWEAHSGYIELMRDMDKKTEVIEEYKTYLDAHKDTALAHYLYAQALYDSDLEQAKINADEALRIDSDFYPAYSVLCKYYDEAKDYDKAIAYGQKAIEINPNYARGYCMIAQAYDRRNEFDKAITNYEKALEFDQYDTRINCNLSRAYALNNELYKAINLAGQAIERDKRPIVQILGYSNRSLFYARMGNQKEALNNLDKAIAIGQAEKSAPLLFMSASDLVYLKEYDKALEILEQVLKYNPDKVLAEQIGTLLKQVQLAKGRESGTDTDQSAYQALEKAEREMLTKVMALPDDQIDLAEVSLTLAKKVYPELDIAKYLRQIDEMATELKTRIGAETEPEKIISLINTYLYKDTSMTVELKIPVKGSYVTEIGSLYEEGNYWLNEVLDTKQGSCMGFGLLYLALAERLKRPIYGVLLPTHIFLRYDDGKTRINIEPTGAGKQIPDDDYCSGKFSPKTVISDNAQPYYLKNVAQKGIIKALIYQRGIWFGSNKMPAKILDDAGKLIEIDPQYSRAYLLQGWFAEANNNLDEALNYYAQAIETSPLFGEAYFRRAWIYHKTKQWKKAIAELDKVIELLPSAKYYAARSFAYTKNTQMDEAFRDANKAIEITPKSPEGYYARGYAYTAIKEYSKALDDLQHYVKLAPDKPDGEALFQIYGCYRGGLGVAKDIKEAIKYLRQSADTGYPDAAFDLGVCYYRGDGIEKNIQEGIKWLRKAAEGGHQKAQYSLGAVYYNGEVVPIDIKEATVWLTKAAEQGDEQAKDALRKLQAEAALSPKAIRERAETGDADAQVELGLAYRSGKGVDKDPIEAVKWFRKAAEQSHPRGLYHLGFCHYAGVGVKKDKLEAVKWWTKAVVMGDDMSKQTLGSITGELSDLIPELTKQADAGDADAQFALGICYRDGLGIDKDNVEATKWLNKAADQGHPQAKQILNK